MILLAIREINFSDMGDPYNYTKHFREHVRPAICELGFKCKNLKFTREIDGLTDEVSLPRSSWNIPGLSPCQFYIEIVLVDDGGTPAFHRLDRPTTVPFPQHYRPFFARGEQMPSDSKRHKLMSSFSSEQLEEIEFYNASRRWGYSNEEELVDLFKLAVETLQQCVDPLFADLRKLKASCSPDEYWPEFVNAVQDHYLKVIPKESRWT